MSIAPAFFDAASPQRPVFASADICREAGLALPAGASRPMFDGDMWDFTEVVGLPVQMPLAVRRFDFTAIADQRWRTVAKELILALLAPRHPAVAPLPRAYRAPLHLRTARGRLGELVTWLNWLAERGVGSLAEVDGDCCQAYLAYRRYIFDHNGIVVGERSPAVRRSAAQVVVDLVSYRELFTADRVSPDLRPWAGASASAIAEMPCGREGNKTPPVHDNVLRPMLAAALHLVIALGPHAVELNRQVRQADQQWSRKAAGFAAPHRVPASEITALLDGYKRSGQALPLLPSHHLQDRLDSGWPPNDPVTPLALDLLARQAGFARFRRHWIPPLRDKIEATLGAVGAEKPFGRAAVPIDRADGEGAVAWTLPLDRLQAVGLVGIVRTAAITALAAISGMRSSEKRAELQQMQHSARLTNGVSAGRRGVRRGRRNVIDGSASTACARPPPPQQCCI